MWRILVPRVRFIVLVLVFTSLAIVAISQSDNFRLRQALYAASESLRERDPDRALKLLTEAARIAPLNGEVDLLFAEAHRRKGDLEKVRKYLEQAKLRGVALSRIRQVEWMATAQTGQLSESAPKLFEQLSNGTDAAADIGEALANGYFVTSRFREAFQVLDAWQKDVPSDPQPHIFRGSFSYENGRWNEALQHFRSAHKLAPQRHDIEFRLADCLLKLGETPSARTHFENVLKSAPENLDARNGLGHLLWAEGKFDDADKCFQFVLCRDPKSSAALLAIGKLSLERNRADEAVAFFSKALVLGKNSVEVRNALAIALQRCGRMNEAKVQFSEVAKFQEQSVRRYELQRRVLLNEQDLDARYELAEINHELGETTERVSWLLSIVELNPHERRAYRMLMEHFESNGDQILADKYRQKSQSVFPPNE